MPEDEWLDALRYPDWTKRWIMADAHRAGMSALERVKRLIDDKLEQVKRQEIRADQAAAARARGA